ncbi:MAG: MBG domain-containing protein [Eubacteriales bacterium]|nr:MBG domain-containing protein [Eubacteriales bacterium]
MESTGTETEPKITETMVTETDGMDTQAPSDSDGTDSQPSSGDAEENSEPAQETDAEENSESTQEFDVEENSESTQESGTEEETDESETSSERAELVKQIQAMIDVLPDAAKITKENAESVAEQLSAIDAARGELTDEEMVMLDFTRYAEAAAALSALNGEPDANEPELLAVDDQAQVKDTDELESALENDAISTIEITESFEWTGTLNTSKEIVVMPGVTFTWYVFEERILKTGELTIESGATMNISVYDGGKATVEGDVKNNGAIIIKAVATGFCYWQADAQGSGVFTAVSNTYVKYDKVPTDWTISGKYKVDIAADISETSMVTLVTSEGTSPTKISVGDTVKASVSNVAEDINPADVFAYQWVDASGNELSTEVSYTVAETLKDGQIKCIVSLKADYVMYNSVSGAITSLESELYDVGLTKVAEVTIGGETTTYSYNEDGTSTYTTALEALDKAWDRANGNTAEIKLFVSVDLARQVGLRVNAGSDITLKMAEGVTLSNSTNNTTNLAILVSNGKFTLESGSISSSTGSAISVNGGSLEIKGGCVKAPGASGYGISASNNVDIVISGGTIEGGWRGVDASNCTVTMTGGQITAAGGNNALYMRNGTTAQISGGTITAPSAIYLSGTEGAESALTIEENAQIISTGTSENNCAVQANSATVTISGGTIKSSSVAVNVLGAISSLEIKDGLILTTAGTFGAVKVQSNAKAEISGGTIQATGMGLFIWSNASVVINGGRIESGTYGIYVSDKSTATMYGGSVSAGSVPAGSSGVFVGGYGDGNGGTFFMNGGTVEGTGPMGRGIENNKVGSMTLTGGTISGTGWSVYTAKSGETVTDFLATGCSYFKGTTVSDETLLKDETILAKQFLFQADGYNVVTIGKVMLTEITVSAEPETVVYGDTPVLTAKVTPADGVTDEITYQWYFVKEDGTTEEISDAQGSTYSPSALGLGTYQYSCKATCGGYSITSSPATVEVEKKTLTISGATASDRVYDGTDAVTVTDVTLTGIVGAEKVSVDLSSVAGTVPSSDAGNYETISLKGLALTDADADNYTIAAEASNVLTNVTISKATGPSTPEVAGSYERDGEYFKYTVSITNAAEGAVYEYRLDEDGKWQESNIFTGLMPNTSHTFYARIAETTNYEAGTAGTVSVTLPRLPGAASVTMENWTYGETANAPIPVSGTNGMQNVTYQYKKQGADDSMYTADVPTDAGAYTVRADFAATNAYEAVQATADFTIFQKELELTLSGTAEKTYDGTTDVNGISIFCSGILEKDAGQVTASFTIAYDSANAGSQTISISESSLTGDRSGNYKLPDPLTTFTGTINPLDLSDSKYSTEIMLTDGTLIYNGETQIQEVKSVTVSWADGQDTKTLTLIAGKDYVISGNQKLDAGEYELTITGTGTDTSGNYIGSVSEIWKIAKRPVTVTPESNQSKAYGEADSPLAYTITEGELAGSDTLNGALSRDSGENAGMYQITQGTLTNENNPNYDITFADSVSFTIAEKSLAGAQVSVSGSFTYDGTEQKPEPVVTLDGAVLVKDRDYTVSYTDNVNAGNATVTVTGIGNYTETASTAFAIQKAIITDISGTTNNVTTPEALASLQKTITDGSNYTASITWKCGSESYEADTYGFGAEYTAVLTLTPDSNHRFANADELAGIVGCTVTGNGSTGDSEEIIALTLERTFPATRLEKLVSAATPGETASESVTLDAHMADADAVIKTLPSTVKITLETGITVEVSVTWSCDNYSTEPNAENTFTWTVTSSAIDGLYDQNGVPLTGTITVTNSDSQTVTITGEDQTVVYDGNEIDLNGLFTIDENAGAATYLVENGSGEGMQTGSGNTLKVTKAGTFTITVQTDAAGIYGAGKAQIILTVRKGNGNASVTISGWTYGEDAQTPVSESSTNGTDAVTYLYESTDGKGYSSETAPVNAGSYKVTATFAATDLYESCTAETNLDVAPRAITVTADDQTKESGDVDPAFTYQITDGTLADGDTLTGITFSRETGEDAGEYAITVSQEDGANPNYAITFVNGKLTIQAAETDETDETDEPSKAGSSDKNSGGSKGNSDKKSGNSEKTSDKKSDASAKTGDPTNLWLWVMMLAVSGSIAAGITVFARRRRTRK